MYAFFINQTKKMNASTFVKKNHSNIQEVKHDIATSIEHISFMDSKNIANMIFDYINERFIDICRESCSTFEDLLIHLQNIYKHPEQKLKKCIVLIGSPTLCTLLINYCLLYYKSCSHITIYDEFPDRDDPRSLIEVINQCKQKRLVLLQGVMIMTFFRRYLMNELLSTEVFYHRNIDDQTATRYSYISSLIVYVHTENLFLEFLQNHPSMASRCLVYKFHDTIDIQHRISQALQQSEIDHSLLEYINSVSASECLE